MNINRLVISKEYNSTQMATAQVKVNFPEQIEESRKKIRDSFKRSHEALQVRENILLSRVDEIEKEYNSKTQEMNKLVEALNKATLQCEETLAANKLTDINQIVRTAIDKKIQELKADTDTNIEFEWDNLFETGIEQLGSIKLNGETMISPTSIFPPHVKPAKMDTNKIERKTFLVEVLKRLKNYDPKTLEKPVSEDVLIKYITSTMGNKSNTVKIKNNYNEYTVMLVGKMGAGKSSLGNFLLQREEFVTGDDIESVTNDNKCESRMITDKIKLRIIDTPGFGDFRGQAKVRDDVANAFYEAKDGVDAFIFVISSTERIGREMVAHFEMFKRFMDHEHFYDYVIPVFTKVDERLKKRGEKDFMSRRTRERC